MKAIVELKRRLDVLPGNVLQDHISIEGFSRAGVLVPLVANGQDLEILFTKRTETVETHKGQIAFPGGMVDICDKDIVGTALREAEEEIGLERDSVSILGTLDDIATPTRFVITPVVGFIKQLPPLTPNPDEVADVFRVPLAFFADEENGRKELREFRGGIHEVWFYDVSGHLVWGATARIIRSLLKHIRADYPAKA
ncbi:MAG: NUDIX hydrolase [Bacteroidota bacterium]